MDDFIRRNAYSLLFFPMTNPEQITTSLEVSKRLREAGWGKTTHNWWMVGEKTILQNIHCDPLYPYNVEWYPAPTAEEILGELPKYIDKGRLSIFSPTDTEPHGSWHISYCERFENYSDVACGMNLVRKRRGKSKHEYCLSESSPSLANASAELWIYLKENKLI